MLNIVEKVASSPLNWLGWYNFLKIGPKCAPHFSHFYAVDQGGEGNAPKLNPMWGKICPAYGFLNFVATTSGTKVTILQVHRVKIFAKPKFFDFQMNN